ncbi:GDP-D-glucose phosphorylase 1 [Thrips palmi]|uniref:GDP-D-glucose phosphorylase 1 n=1 Tax=Thrips palmi TaxID=161013 RepID=A0A6P8ZUD6_THRPL|nr:GDP-D-glucose phosphorylase 1 [Thrips palmi]
MSSKILKINFKNAVASVSWNKTGANPSNLSSFDNELLSAWNDAMRSGYFRYKVNIQGSSIIPGKWNFFAMLNPDRGENRRKPQEFNSVNDPFDPASFNFTRIKNEEILFTLDATDNEQKLYNEDLLAINVSPINEGHSLILPCRNKMNPQVLDLHSIELGLRILLMSSSPSFRVAFNSLCAFASVNHLHLHCLYVDCPMRLESIDLLPFEGPCFQVKNYPSHGFVFQCLAESENDVKTLSRNVFKLTSFLSSQNEAHNVIMTRSKLTESDQDLSHIRVYVWVRKSNMGAKDTTGFNPAALELFGYFMYKDADNYKNADEAKLCRVLEDLTQEPFEKNCENVRLLFKE